MRYYAVIVLVLLFQNTFSQTYSFDRFIQYNGNRLERTIFMFNSKNTRYYFVARSYGEEIIGNIIDLENKVRHRYSLTNAENEVSFEYLSSSAETATKSSCYDKNNVIEVTATPLDSLNTNFTVLKFKNSKKKRIIQSAKITAAKSEIPAFSLMMKMLFGHFADCHKIVLPENYIPTSVTIDYFNGIKTQEKLIQNKKVNTVLSVNKKT